MTRRVLVSQSKRERENGVDVALARTFDPPQPPTSMAPAIYTRHAGFNGSRSRRSVDDRHISPALETWQERMPYFHLLNSMLFNKVKSTSRSTISSRESLSPFIGCLEERMNHRKIPRLFIQSSCSNNAAVPRAWYEACVGNHFDSPTCSKLKLVPCLLPRSLT